MANATPVVEVSDHSYGQCIGSPDLKRNTVTEAKITVDRGQVRAKCSPELLVPPLTDQVKVKLADGRCVSVWVVRGPGAVVLVNGVDSVVWQFFRSHIGDPDATFEMLEFDGLVFTERNRNLLGKWSQNPDLPATIDRMRAQKRVRIMVRSRGDSVDVGHDYFFRFTCRMCTGSAWGSSRT